MSPSSATQANQPSLGAGINFADPHSPWARFYLDRPQVVATLILSLVFLLAVNFRLWHTDVWGHLKFGQWMVNASQLPTTEPFTANADPNSPFLETYWLCQSTFALIYQAGTQLVSGGPLEKMAGGVELLIFTHAALVVLRLLLLFLAFQRVTGSSTLACMGLVIVLVLQVGHIAIFRPQVLGEVFLAALLFMLSRPTLSRTAMFVIPILTVLWANCHGSYLLSFILLGGCFLGRAISVHRHLFGDLHAQRLFCAALLSAALICMLTPSGPMTFWNTLMMSKHPNVLVMDEWQPLAFALDSGPMWFYLATWIIVLGAQLASPRWYSPTQVILIALFATLPLIHQRAMVWWLVILPWLVLPHLAAIRQRRLAARPTPPSALPCLRKTFLAMAILLMVAWLCAPAEWIRAGHPRPLDRLVSEGTPWQISAHLNGMGNLPPLDEALREHYPDGQFTGGIFASETLGDFLLWTLPPDYPIFIYSHVHLFPPEHWQRVAIVKRGEPGWQEVLDRAGINMVIIEPELHTTLRAELYRSDDWLVLADETGQEAIADKRNRLLLALRVPPTTR